MCVCRITTSAQQEVICVCSANVTQWVPSPGCVTVRVGSASASRVLLVDSATAVITLLLRSRPTAAKVRGHMTDMDLCVCVCETCGMCVRDECVFFHSVIYDSCPQAMEAEIWWPRTKFGLPAAAPCPRGSTGKHTVRPYPPKNIPTSGHCRNDQVLAVLCACVSQGLPSDTVMNIEDGFPPTFSTAPPSPSLESNLW